MLPEDVVPASVQEHRRDPADPPRFGPVARAVDRAGIEGGMEDRRLQVRKLVEEPDREVGDDDRDVDDRQAPRRDSTRERKHAPSLSATGVRRGKVTKTDRLRAEVAAVEAACDDRARGIGSPYPAIGSDIACARLACRRTTTRSEGTCGHDARPRRACGRLVASSNEPGSRRRHSSAGSIAPLTSASAKRDARRTLPI